MAVCEILCVGTELLLGDILNTNEQFLSKELAAMGISVMHRSSVGDNPERLAQELKTALGRSDIVITSGGLGPTDDDLTKEVCCEVMGFELREDEDTAAHTLIFQIKGRQYAREQPQAGDAARRRHRV